MRLCPHLAFHSLESSTCMAGPHLAARLQSWTRDYMSALASYATLSTRSDTRGLERSVAHLQAVVSRQLAHATRSMPRWRRASLDLLPSADLRVVCSFLDVIDCEALCATNRHLRQQLIDAPGIWRDTSPLSYPAPLRWIRARITHLVERSAPLSVSLSTLLTDLNIDDRMEAIQAALPRATNLTIYGVNQPHLWKVLLALSQPAPILRFMQLFLGFSDDLPSLRWDVPFSGQAPALNELALRCGPTFVVDWHAFGHITQLRYDVLGDMTITDLVHLLDALPRLVCLSLSPSNCLFAAEALPKYLRHVTLRRLCLVLPPDQLQAVVQILDCPALRYLELSGRSWLDQWLTEKYDVTGVRISEGTAVLAARTSTQPVIIYCYVGRNCTLAQFDPLLGFANLTWLALEEPMWPTENTPRMLAGVTTLGICLAKCNEQWLTGIFCSPLPTPWHLPDLRQIFLTASQTADHPHLSLPCSVCMTPSVSLADCASFVRSNIRTNAETLDCVTIAGMQVIPHDFIPGWEAMSRLTSRIDIVDRDRHFEFSAYPDSSPSDDSFEDFYVWQNETD